MKSYNEGVDNEALPHERKGYRVRNPTNVKYSEKRATRSFMGRNNIIFGYNELHSVTKSYANVVDAIAYFFKLTPKTNIITNDTILTQ